MKKLFLPILIVLILSITGCVAPKKVLYLQDAIPFQQDTITQSYQSMIQQDDILSIVVEGNDLEAIKPFNKQVPSTSSTISLVERGYLVNVRGEIVFPMIGKIHAAGMTTIELADTITQKLIDNKYLKDPAVSVALLNFKFSILGEAGSKNTYNVPSERLTLLEALSMAGDLTIQGKRDRIAIIREINGIRTTVYIDIRSKEFMNSPYYYICQNDVIYVEPNKTRVNQSGDRQTVPYIFSIASFLMTLALLIM